MSTWLPYATGHDRGRLQFLVGVLLADPHGDVVGRARFAEQLEQHDLLLQRLEHRLDRGLELRAVAGQVGHAADDHPAGGLAAQHLQQGGDAGLADHRQRRAAARRRSCCSRDGRLGGRSARRPRRSGARAARPGSRSSCSGSSRARCSIRPVEVIRISSSRDAGQRDDLDVPDRGVAQRRVLHDGHLLGDLGEQPDGAPQHVVEVEGTGQEGLDGPLLGRRQRLAPCRAGRRTADSPCRSGSGRRWCAAG